MPMKFILGLVVRLGMSIKFCFLIEKGHYQDINSWEFPLIKGVTLQLNESS